MEETREEHVWLLRSRFNPNPVAGSLTLTEASISFKLTPGTDDAALGWLEEILGIDGLGKKLVRGDEVVAFSYLLAECEVTWPITGGGATMIVQAEGRRWVITYDDPTGGPMAQTLTFISGRRKAKHWKRALAEAGS